MAKLLLVRHGLTEYNTTRRFAGHTDVDLSDDGCRQIERLRDHLADEKIDAVYASDLRRAWTSAEIITNGHKVDIVACPELREINYGEVEGLKFEEIGRSYPEVAKYVINFNQRLEFPGGESFTEFSNRTNTFLDRLNDHAQEDTILVVAHSGPIRVLLCRLLDISLEHWWQLGCNNASLSIVDTYQQGAIISLLNGISHLKNNS